MTEAFHIRTNPSVLCWARESIVISKNKAAERIKISTKRLEQLETGEKYPSMTELKAMSKIYKRTIATLLLKAPPKEKPLPKDRRTINSEDLGVFDERTIMAVRKSRALVSSLVELRNEFNLPLIPFNYKADLQDDPNVIAKNLRNEWNFSKIGDIGTANSLLEYYIEHFESIGIAIFQISLTQDKLRGFSLVDEVMPVIVIKRGGEKPTAKIFSLFHELGHILLNEGGLCDIIFSNDSQEIEKWCNAFAAEILVPSSELLKIEKVIEHTQNEELIWQSKELIEIASKFQVGPLVILRRLLDNNLTSKEFYKQRHEVWSKPSFGRSKSPEGRDIPKETVKEKGRQYLSLAFNAYDKNKIDLKDLSDFLGVKLSYIPKTRQLLSI